MLTARRLTPPSPRARCSPRLAGQRAAGVRSRPASQPRTAPSTSPAASAAHRHACSLGRGRQGSTRSVRGAADRSGTPQVPSSHGAAAGTTAGRCDARRLHRAVRRPDGRHDRLGDPRPVRRRLPARGRVARRRHAVHHARCRSTPSASCCPTCSRPRAPRRCSTAPARATRAARADLRRHGASRASRPRPTTSSSPSAASRRSTSSPASSATPATSSSPRRRRTSARSARSRPTRREVLHVPMDEHGLVPDALREARGAARRAPSSSTRSPTSTTRPAPRSRTPGATRCWRSARRPGSSCSRTTRTACSASTARRSARSRRAPASTTSSTSGRSARPSRRACGSAGCSRRTPCARSWCWPPRRRVLCPPALNQMAVVEYLSTQDWQGQVEVFKGIYRERRDAMLDVAAAAHAGRHHLDAPRRRLLRLDDAAGGARREGDAAAGDHRADRVRAGHRLLRRRAGPARAAPVVLLPRARPHPRGRPPPRRRRRGRARAAVDVRPHHPRRSTSAAVQTPAPDMA